MSGAFVGAYALSYVAAANFMLFFLVLLVMKGTVQRELGICEWQRGGKCGGGGEGQLGVAWQYLMGLCAAQPGRL